MGCHLGVGFCREERVQGMPRFMSARCGWDGRCAAPTLGRVGASLTLAVTVVWVLVLVFVSPIPLGDYGVFVTVAERLQVGDRLYAEVWDNKEPVFFFLLALGRFVSPLSGWALEFGWIATACAATYVIAARAGASVRRSVVIAALGAPLILTGSWYWAGNSHMPGIALTLAAIGFVAGRHAVVGGLLLGVIPFVKILVAPVAVIAIAVLLLQQRSPVAALKVVAAAAASAISIVVLLALRGELGGFLSLLLYNSDYQSAQLGRPGVGDLIRDHLAAVIRGPALLAVVAMVAVALWLFWPRSTWTSQTHMSRCASALGFATLLGSLLVIALTGLWLHHANLLSIPALLLLIALGTSIRHRDSWAVFVPIVAVAYLMGGAPDLTRYLHKLEYARADVSAQLDVPDLKLDAVAVNEQTFARVGAGDDFGIGRILDGWELACPRFAQQPWETAVSLDSTLKCLEGANVIYVQEGGFTATENQSPWSRYVMGVRALLADRYTCSSVDRGQLCVKDSAKLTTG